ncbi:hypothetical protein MKW98_032462 [Papaver atlanticum]|uniref:histidine kinase n=1 Tax=Papaver atlanticum TaxID=357466 RepID=A0AAD4SWI1_9MAGN|nr:hypothetical protein MKW98_032462 [Papaver atlanticum]
MQGFLVLAIPISAILSYQIVAYQVQDGLEFAAKYLLDHIFSDVQAVSHSLLPNAAALNLASVLGSSFKETTTPMFSKISTMVAPKLLLTFMVHNVSQISYLQSNGLFFSYYMDGNETVSLYSNATCVDDKERATSTSSYNLYKQPIDKNTGEPYGEVSIISNSDICFKNSFWFRKAMQSKNGYAFVGNVLGSNNSSSTHSLFHSMAAINGEGVVSLGVSVKAFVDAIKRVNTLNGTLFLGTNEGKILTHNNNLNANIVINDASVSIEVMKDGDNIGNDHRSGIAIISCDPSRDLLRADEIEIGRERYHIYCQPLDIAGIKAASIMVFRDNGLLTQVRRNDSVSSLLLALAIISVFLSTAFFIVLISRGTRREMFLSATLMKQMEATQQAERRSMNKSIAFASANHDIRGALATIVGLIEFCLTEVSPGSNLDNNLSQMKSASLDLLELLNSVLDASRIEAGKMQLHEEFFDLAKVIEEAVNFIYPRGLEKRIDVVLDHCDGSVLKSPLVKGDRGKLKQVLNNLLSNAVKFTSEGHVVLRAWARKSNPNASLLSPKYNGIWERISHLLYNNIGQDYNETLHTFEHNENSLELIVEVDDTGKGIPKEKRDSIFENFVQVKETALGQGGTGLGLGIVQSLVRLMGGEISILDKEISEKGTCFSFNIFLSQDGNTMHTTRLYQSPCKIEGLSSSHVILVIQDDERRNVTKNFMRTLGVKVSAINQWEHVLLTLQQIKRRFYVNSRSISGKSEQLGLYTDYLSQSTSHSPITAMYDGSLSGNEQAEASRSSTPRRRTILARNATLPFIMIIIDDHVEPISEVCSVVANFRNNLPGDMRFRIVGLLSPIITEKNMRIARKRLMVSCDDIFIKPFHGSRLDQVLKLLPEFGGNIREGILSNAMDEHATELLSSTKKNFYPRADGIVQQEGVIPSTDDFNILNGKKVLVVEDQFVLRRMATAILSRLGAIVEVCENGEEAVKQVSKSLKEPDHRPEGTSKFLPYDYILMDCQMPIMDGYEATRRIRMAERFYKIHIPIIALTANEAGDEADMRKEAGMDFHITKPLKVDSLLDAIRFLDTINTRNTLV